MRQTRTIEKTVERGPAVIDQAGVATPGPIARVVEKTAEPVAIELDAEDTRGLLAHLTDSVLVDALCAQSSDSVATVGAAIKLLLCEHKTRLAILKHLAQVEGDLEQALPLADAMVAMLAAHPELKIVAEKYLDGARSTATERLKVLRDVWTAREQGLLLQTDGLEAIVAAFRKATAP